jgi:hypothetical protein
MLSLESHAVNIDVLVLLPRLAFTGVKIHLLFQETHELCVPASFASIPAYHSVGNCSKTFTCTRLLTFLGVVNRLIKHGLTQHADICRC